jgi:hypothetical protein
VAIATPANWARSLRRTDELQFKSEILIRPSSEILPTISSDWPCSWQLRRAGSDLPGVTAALIMEQVIDGYRAALRQDAGEIDDAPKSIQLVMKKSTT